MAEDKKSFILYADLINSIDHLTYEEKGILFTHLLDYVNDKNPVLTDRLVLTAWKPIEEQLKRDLRKFKEVKVKRSEAGKKSAELRQQNSTKSTSVESVQQMSTNSTVSDTVNGNENVNDNDILLEKETKGENQDFLQNQISEDEELFESVNPETAKEKKVALKKEKFRPPTVQEVQDYCNERQNGIQAYTFINFYQSKGWKVGNQPMKDWHAAIRTWESKNKEQNGNSNTGQSNSNSGNATGHGFKNPGKVSARTVLAKRLADQNQNQFSDSDGGNITVDAEIVN